MKKKSFFSILLSLLLIFHLVLAPVPAQAALYIPITAPSVILIDSVTHQVLYAKTPHLKRAPASTAKILTAIVALENLPLDRVVSIPAFAEQTEPSKIHARQGERYYVRDLIRATLISSANDAAEVLGVAAGGSRAGFSSMMNQKARSIGAKRSHFVRASGLPAKNQYSTAYDMALIMQYAGRYPFLVSTLRTKQTVIQSLDGRRIFLKNHNKMLWRGHREVIGKTGWTRQARHCFVGEIGFNHKVFIAMLGSHRLWRDLKTIVDYHFGKSISPVRQNRKLWGRRESASIQVALQRAGFNPGPVDGSFGPQTVTAIQRFQASHGLPADGVAGPQTWKALRRYL